MRKVIVLAAVVLISSLGGTGAAMAASTASDAAPCWKSGTTADIANCFAASEKEADDRLTVLYGQILSVLEPNERQDLQKAESLWVAYRAAACDAERNLWEGGSGGPPVYLACMDDETRHHLDYLQVTYRLRLQKLAH